MKGSHLIAVGTLVAAAAAVDEVQTITPGGAPDAGTFKLSFDGVETAAIDFDASDTEIRDAINAVLGVSAVSVVGDLTTDIEITYGGLIGPQNLVVVVDNTLEEMAAPVALVVTRDTAGVEEKSLSPTAWTELDLYRPDGSRISGDLLPNPISFVQFLNPGTDKLLLGASNGASTFEDAAVEAVDGVEVVISANQRVALKTAKATAITTGTFKAYLYG